MSKSNVKTSKLNLLKLEHQKLIEELDELKNELNKAKRGTDRTYSNSLIEDLFNEEQTIYKTITLPSKKTTKKSNTQSRLALYELTSGIHIENISMEYFPLHDKNNLIDTSWFKFEVDARINKIGFHVSYVSNQDIEACYNDKITSWDIKKLDFTMDENFHQTELKEGLDYFSNNPSKMALAFNCIRDYNKLFYERRNVKRVITKENSDLVKCDLIIEDDQGYLEINVYSSLTKREYFKILWSITWDEKVSTVIDSFKINIPYKDELFLESISHNFEKLLKSPDRPEMSLYQDTDKIGEVGIVKSSTHSEEVKLNLLQNALLAVRASEAN